MKKKLSKEQVRDRHVSRRQFLCGASSALAIPALVSLMPNAVAQSLESQKRKRLCLFSALFGMNSGHLLGNAISHPNWQTQATGILNMRYGKLSEIPGNISYVFDGKFDAYRNDANLFQGLDMMSPFGHNYGFYAGAEGIQGKINEGRTIDVIVENSAAFKSSFQGNTPVIRQSNSRWSPPFAYDRNRDLAGNFLPGQDNSFSPRHDVSDDDLFRRLFGSISSQAVAPDANALSRRQLLVDEVLEDFKTLKNHRRISGNDKTLLDQFINTIFEVQSKVQFSSSAACTTISNKFVKQTKHGDPLDQIGDWDQYWKNVFAMVVAAFSCDQSRVFSSVHDIGNISHHDMDNSEAEMYGSKHQKDWLNRMVEHLIKPMKEIQDVGGGSMLDNSLVVWHNEHEGRGHGHSNIPIMTFGQLSGKLRSGYIMNYDQSASKNSQGYPFRGFPSKMMMVSILEAMGVTRAEILREGDANGFGFWQDAYSNADSQGNRSWVLRDSYDMRYFATNHTNILPFFTKA